MKDIFQQALAALGLQPQQPAAKKLSYAEAINQMKASGWKESAAQPQQQIATPQPQQIQPQQMQQPQSQGMPTPQATPIAIPQEQLRQNISDTWGANTPMLNNLDLFTQAGNQLPGNMEKLLPIALALRETQGGKDNMKPNTITGDNNQLNIRHAGEFVDYPNLPTALLGGANPEASEGRSSGLLGLLSGDKKSNKGIYEDFRRTNDYKDLFKKWSPSNDGNGSMDEQIQNINWILNKIKNGKAAQ